MKLWRKTKDYRIWRIKVIRRDKKCAVCGSVKNRQAHHKNHASYFPEDRFNINNGVTLCKKCHMQYHCNYHRSFRQKCTEYDWNNFLTLFSYIQKILKK